jgi:hypothetical protein
MRRPQYRLLVLALPLLVLAQWGAMRCSDDDRGVADHAAPATAPPPATDAAPTAPAPTSVAPSRPAATAATDEPVATTTEGLGDDADDAAPVPAAPVPAALSSGVVFRAGFDTESDFYDRFDTHTGNFCTDGVSCRPEDIPDGVTSFPGDHDESCAGPDTQREIDVSNHADLFWWCAPGGDAAKGHLMIGNDTTGYAILGITPKQMFTDVTRVCFDLNQTDLGGGKWFNMVIVPEAEYLAHRNENPRRSEEREGEYRLDYTSPGFNAPNAPGDFNIQGGPTFGMKVFQGTVKVWQENESDQFIFESHESWNNGNDRATRFEHCITDNGDGTLTATQQRPDGERSWTFDGHIPAGQVRVVFQNDDYNTIKHDGRPGYKTWHIDNIEISAAE